MRIFERLRANFEALRVQPQDDLKERRELANVAATSHVPAAAEGFCCGHCSGNLEGHLSELPSAR